MAMHKTFQNEVESKERAHKCDNRGKYVVALDVTIDPRHVGLNPVKLLLALALRTGAVDNHHRPVRHFRTQPCLMYGQM